MRGVYAEEVRKVRSGKPVAVFAVLLVVSFATMNAMPSDTLLAALLQEAVLALVALAAVGFAVPDALKRCTQIRATTEYCAVYSDYLALGGSCRRRDNASDLVVCRWWHYGGLCVYCVAVDCRSYGKPAALVRHLPAHRSVRGIVHARARHRGVRARIRARQSRFRTRYRRTRCPPRCLQARCWWTLCPFCRFRIRSWRTRWRLRRNRARCR